MALWEGRFPLLLHHLDQHHDQVVAGQWQEDWLLALAADTVTIMHYLLFLSPFTDCQSRWRHVTAGIFGMVVDLYLLLSTTYNLLDCHYPVPVSSPDNPWIYSP